jgi:hypothetical protein
MVVLGQKLGGGHVDHSVGLGLCREPYFSRAVHMAYVDWRGKCTYRVYQVFPYRVYIDSNRHDSRI